MKRKFTCFKKAFNHIRFGLLLTGIVTQLVMLQAQPCNVPLAGKGRVIDQLEGGTACLLCGSTDLENIVDGNLTNYAVFSLPLVVATPTPVISVKDIGQDFSGGDRAGFVVETTGGLLTASLLGSFQIRTYLDNTLQETITTGNGLTVDLLGSSGGKQRISFITSQDFDEIALYMTSGLGLLGSMRIYYAYEEPANGCDYSCRTPLVSGVSGFNPTINTAATNVSGGCVGCSISNAPNVVDASLTNYGQIIITLGIGGTGTIAVALGGTVPAGSSAGFMVRNNNGTLLNLTLLGGTFIDLYRAGTLKQSFAANSALIDVNVLSDNIHALTVNADSSFDEMRIRVTGVTLGVNLRVYYPFYSPDADNDDFPDCVDRCTGADDNFDLDGDGLPDACDTSDCMINAGLDAAACPPGTSAQVPAAGSGQSWSSVAGNPSAATINNAGAITGLAAEGTYYFQLSDTNGCRDTVAIVYQTSALADSCNNPILGHGVVAFDPSAGNCLLCANASLALDGLLNTSADLDASIGISPGTPVLGVWDTMHVYPAGRRVGFVVEAVGGLLNLSLLSNFEIRTYLNGVLQESATTGNTLLGAGILPGPGNRQRISFVTTDSFDAVVLVANALLSTIDSFRLYYAFEEPANACPDLSNESCADAWLVNNDFCADIAEDRTGLSGVACVGCSITAIGNLIDANENNAATITLTVGVGAEASISVSTIQTFDETYQAGFVISGGANLLDAAVLAGLRLRTYLNGVLIDNYYANNGLIDITVLGDGSGKGFVSFQPTGDFNEIRLTIYGLVNALQSTQVYYAFTRRDSDQDNTPDCIDKCCLGTDDIDTDGDGSPDSCDPVADVSIDVTASNNMPAYASTVTLTLKVKNTGPAAATGLAVENIVPSGFTNISNISNGGILTDSIISWAGLGIPAGDSITLSFQATVVRNGSYINSAEISVLAEDDPDADANAGFDADDLDDNVADDDEDTLVLTPVNTAPTTLNDTAATPEDTGVYIDVLLNDTDANGDTLQIFNVLDITAGMAVISGDSILYIPDSNFNGVDSFRYIGCDGYGGCDTAWVFVTVAPANDPPAAVDDQVVTNEDISLTFNPLANDTDPEGNIDATSVAVFDGPAHGTATVHPVTGAIAYTPDADFYGSDTLSYSVCDQGAPVLCDSGIVVIIVNPSVERCNIPLVGKGRVVDQLNGGTACALCGNADLENIVDGDLSNYSAYDPILIVLPTPVVSVKNVQADYEAGQRVGFVVQPQGGLLDLGLLDKFAIRTYLNNTLQETYSGAGLTLNALGASGGKQRISFVATAPFDEVELVQTSVLTLLGSLRVFYAFVEPAGGCDFNCITPVTPPAYSAAAINPALTGISGILCLLCDVDDEANVVDTDTSDFGRIILTVGLGVQGAISVDAGDTIPAGYDAGFAIAQNSGGLVDIAVLNATFIETYLNGTLQETAPFSSLADISLAGGRQLLSFKTAEDFDELRIRVNSLLAAAVNMNVYYAFVRPDADNDGFPDCVDKCSGQDDNLDMDGDGLPDACDTLDCMVNAGLDISSCPADGQAQLPAAGMGEVWSALPGNPAAAGVDSTGAISGMTVEGTYYFELSGSGGCRDTVAVLNQTGALTDSCNNPITGLGVMAFDPTGGSCLLCLNAGLVLDGLLNTSVSLDAGIGIGVGTPVIGVWDTLQDYPGGRRVGFVVEAVGGLLDLSLLSNFEIRTYKDGNLQETATVGNSLLNAGVLPGPGNRQRIGFIAADSFDAVVLFANALLSTIDSFRVYYAFEEPAAGCPDLAAEDCADAWLVNNTYCADIVEARTGLNGVACAGCSISAIGNLIDPDPDNAANITLTIGAGASASVSVKTVQTLDEKYQAGFVISGGANLLDATVLAGLQLRTYLNGAPVDNYFANNSLVDITLLSFDSNRGLVSFKPTGPFNEIRLTVYGVVNALQSTLVYHAFARPDSDEDNTPDCIDKCCSGSDDMDTDGDGTPNDCDQTNTPPLAGDDQVTTPEDVVVAIPVLGNDTDIDHGLDTASVAIVSAPGHGTVTVDSLSGTISYTPAPDFYGADTLVYAVCDQGIPPACDSATVYITVVPADVRLTLKMRLQGALFGSPDTTLMRDDLRASGYLPAGEPYSNLAAFMHVNGGGGETVTNTELVFANNGPNSIVDWVFVELRDSANPLAVTATRAGLLQRDGDVVDTDGVSLLEFDSSAPAAYYVAIRHRNHLGAMTAGPVALSATGTPIDFTNLATALWDDGTNLNGFEQVTLWGKFALWAGNVNMDNKVVFAGQSNDKDPIFNAVDQAPGNIFRSQAYNYAGYHLGDVNLSGKAIFAGQNNDVDYIFNNVDGHPRNILRSQAYAIRQQLPQ